MIDLKMLELSLYEDIPHLLVPVVTDPKKAVVVLKNLVEQMDERYRLLKEKRRAQHRRLQPADRRGARSGADRAVIELQARWSTTTRTTTSVTPRRRCPSACRRSW